MPAKPHLIWIILDTHRFDSLGCYGNPRPVSPNLDAFSQTATLFENAIAPAQWTIPSHASMFTGEFPTTHQVTQSGDMLDPAFHTAAEWLKTNGYETSGFCNNPLVGVIDNGFKRGFDTFYNYGGAVPSTPAHSTHQPLRLLSQVWERYTQLLRRISYPVQNAVARSERMFHLSLNPLFVPLWTRFANFKGDTRQSILDATQFIQKKVAFGDSTPGMLSPGGNHCPQFVFLNLMETHLPFTPPEPFRSRFAPILKDEPGAADFMRVYNSQALRWLLPMQEPFSQLEEKTLIQMYEAEVAYQDHLLGRLLAILDQPFYRENAAVIIASDHGEMLGEHRLMGHSFGVYEELVHVPLMVRLPGQQAGCRVKPPVSTAQIYHTLLDLAQVEPAEALNIPLENLPELSLARWTRQNSPQSLPAIEQHGASQVFSEAYPPQNVIKILEKNTSPLLIEFACRSVYRAAYNQYAEKLIQIDSLPDQYLQLENDPAEMQNLLGAHPYSVQLLTSGLERFVETAQQRQPANWTRQAVALDDQLVQQRLRSLGYLE